LQKSCEAKKREEGTLTEFGMKLGKESDGKIDHFQRTGHNTSTTTETRKPMAHLAVVALDTVRLGFSLRKPVWRYQFRIPVPTVRIIYLNVELL